MSIKQLSLLTVLVLAFCYLVASCFAEVVDGTDSTIDGYQRDDSDLEIPLVATEQPVAYIPIVTSSDPPAPVEAIVVDHRHTDVSRIPDYWIGQAKQCAVHYAHTSHGLQILSGLNWLEARDPKYNVDIVVNDTVMLPADATALRFYNGNNYAGNTYIAPEMYWSTVNGRNHTRSAECGRHRLVRPLALDLVWANV